MTKDEFNKLKVGDTVYLISQNPKPFKVVSIDPHNVIKFDHEIAPGLYNWNFYDSMSTSVSAAKIGKILHQNDLRQLFEFIEQSRKNDKS